MENEYRAKGAHHLAVARPLLSQQVYLKTFKAFKTLTLEWEGELSAEFPCVTSHVITPFSKDQFLQDEGLETLN